MQNMQGQSINDIEILYFKLHTWDYEFDYDIELHSSDDAYMMHKCIATAFCVLYFNTENGSIALCGKLINVWEDSKSSEIIIYKVA